METGKEMKDQRGIYYYPILANKALKMYVRLGADAIEFRLWDDNDQSLWDEHGWVPYPAILQAAELYKQEGRKGAPPLEMYDIDIAVRLLRDELQEEKDG